MSKHAYIVRALFESDNVRMRAQVDNKVGGQIDERHRRYIMQENRQWTDIGNAREVFEQSHVGHLFLVIVRRKYDRVVGSGDFHQLAYVESFFQRWNDMIVFLIC